MYRYFPLIAIVSISSVLTFGFINKPSQNAMEYDSCDERYTICYYELRNVKRKGI